MATGMTKTQLVRHMAEQTELEQQAGRGVSRDVRRTCDQRDQEERHFHSAGPGPSGEVEPQGAHGPQSANRRSNQDSCQDRGEVPRGQGREGRDRTQEVVLRFLWTQGRPRAGLLHCGPLFAAFNNCREESITRMHAWQRAQEFPAEQRVQIAPHQLSRFAQTLQFLAAIAELIRRIVAQHLLDHVLVLLAFQRTRRVNCASARNELMQRGAKNRNLPRVQIAQVLWREPPLDLRIARQRSGARTRNVGKHAIEAALQRQRERVGVDDLHVRRPHPSSQQIGAMRVQLRGYDFRRGIASRQRCGLAAGSSAAVEQPRTRAD